MYRLLCNKNGKVREKCLDLSTIALQGIPPLQIRYRRQSCAQKGDGVGARNYDILEAVRTFQKE